MAFVLVHGGAGDHGPQGPRRRRFCKKLVVKGKQLLDAGHTHESVATQLCFDLEASGLFNAGIGSQLNEHGLIEQDAGFATSRGMVSASVGALPGALSASRVAHAVYRQRVECSDPIGRSSPVLLSGQGAFEFAKANNLTCELDHPVAQARARTAHQYWSTQLANTRVTDTVGVVVSNGVDLSLATSSGGASMKPLGRIGPAAINGAGFAIVRAENKITAVLTTGNGEDILTTNCALQTALGLSNSSSELSYEPDVLRCVFATLQHYNLQASPPQIGLVCVQMNPGMNTASICHAYTSRSMLVALYKDNWSRACLSQNPAFGRPCIESL